MAVRIRLRFRTTLKHMVMETKQVVKSDFFAGSLPDLSKAEAAPLELNGEYWTPEREGEVRRMFFKELRVETTTDPAGSLFRPGDRREQTGCPAGEPPSDRRHGVVGHQGGYSP